MTEKRSPVVAILGHVDHGKTTLLDFIRKANVAAREAGGITQSVGAYEIVHGDRKITFVDTPGHEAFATMRAHGAKVADLAVLVVAADDGVKPQTKDALAAIATAGVPYLVAVTKIDKSNANVEKVKQELAASGVLLEGYGGSVTWHAVSGKTGEGVPELLDLILLATDLLGLTWDKEAPASGVVLSSRLDARRGVLAGIVVKNGVLRVGDMIATETLKGKVKALEDFTGARAKELVPCAPALIGGFEAPPQVGEEFRAGGEAAIAEVYHGMVSPVSQSSRSEKTEDGVRLILKADERGSLEALAVVVEKTCREAPCRIVEKSIGNIYEGDIKLAESTGALVLGFRVKADRAAENLAEGKKVTIAIANIIYELEKFLEARLRGEKKEEGATLEILAVFGAGKGEEQIVGGRITEGTVKNRALFKVFRGGREVGEGQIVNLQSKKKNISEATAGTEVGLLVESSAAITKEDTLRFSGS
ncbi:MAG: GTP-binding protein [Candidatus Brennerbacteria bacterium]|nr:GTP-binding protein [Candidatus Brennerbacteria bacterium]